MDSYVYLVNKEIAQLSPAQQQPSPAQPSQAKPIFNCNSLTELALTLDVCSFGRSVGRHVFFSRG